MSAEELDQEESDDTLFEHHRVVVDPGQHIKRIDKFLVDRLERTSRSKIQNACDNGFVKVNGVVTKSSYKIKPNDVISIEMPYPVHDKEVVPENIPLEIIYEDDDLIVLNKPMNMVVHPGFGNYSGTLVNALVYHFQNLPKRTDSHPGLVHRLDKHTTGVMVIAKTEYALAHLAKQFYDRTIERRYVAIAWGDVEKDGTVTGHVGRTIQDRKVFAVFEDGSRGKHAVTHYKVIERLGYVTFVECKLETGRTHQIRVHMKHIGHTLFGDLEYGGDKVLRGTTFAKYKQFVENCFTILPRQALHARSLGFVHPTTGEYMYFEKDLPDDMREVLERWRKYAAQGLND
jgi:23S rRNA pseudouridine1911/1915/1917 synthase